MTRILMLAAATAMIAACGSGDGGDIGNAGEPRSDAVAPSPEANGAAAAETRSRAPATAPSPAQAIPPAFQGVFDAPRHACAGPSEYRLTVSAGELRFHESIGIVRAVTEDGPDTIRVAADYQGEGESWSNVRALRLSDGGMTLTITGEGTSLTRYRCD
jgi:hypothetical protein